MHTNAHTQTHPFPFPCVGGGGNVLSSHTHTVVAPQFQFIALQLISNQRGERGQQIGLTLTLATLLLFILLLLY